MEIDRFVKLTEARVLFGVSRETLWRWRRDGRLPPVVELGPKVRGWPMSVVQQLIAGRRA